MGWDAPTLLGVTLLAFGLFAAALNLRRSAAPRPPHWFLGSVWGPLLPVTIGTLVLAGALMRALASALP